MLWSSLSDDQGWGDLSFNGNTNLATPNIDQLAARRRILCQFLCESGMFTNAG